MNVSGMVRNRRLARAIADASMAGFVTKMEYKCLLVVAGAQQQ